MITKRNGKKVSFDARKIEEAIRKAMLETTNGVNLEVISKISNEIQLAYMNSSIQDMSVEEIQDMVEDKLVQHGRLDVAKTYIKYRYARQMKRIQKEKINKQLADIFDAKNVQNSNANVDEKSASGKEKTATEFILKEYALDNLIDPEVAQAHRDGLVYTHDLDKYAIGIHNCLNADVGYLLKNGFSTRNGDVRPANRFSTACQLVAVIFQLQSQNQYGGVGSNMIDYQLAPYVKKSFTNHLNKGIKWFEDDMFEPLKDVSMDNLEMQKKYPKAWAYALEMMEAEGLQSTQALYHNLNTLESRAGSQVPFTSLNYGTDTSTEGQKVSEWLLHASVDGIGKNNVTPIFPIAIFKYKKGINDIPGTPNYYLRVLAEKSLSKRIYPNIVNCDWSMNKEDGTPDAEMSTMGCRTFTMYDRHGYGYRKTGRGNCTPVTINLPMIAVKNSLAREDKTPDFEGFWNDLRHALEIAEKGLVDRFNYICSQSTENAPFMYNNGICVDSVEAKENGIYETMKHFTLNFGLCGVAEMCQAMIGANHAQSREAHAFALQVYDFINEFKNEATERRNLNFAMYATPAESTAGKFCEKIIEKYGEIKGVTDKGFITNSHHAPVWEELSIKDKLLIEAPFCKYVTAGCITYVELESSVANNTEAVRSIIDYAMGLDIPYLAINFPIDTCSECGHTGEIEENCPVCGSEDIIRLRRVTGYLTTDYRNFNKSKQKEVPLRHKHSKTTH